MNKNIVKIAGLVIAAFLLNIGYLTYLQVFKADELLNHPRNRRLQSLEEKVYRGRILDSKGRVLAETITENGTKRRTYPYGEVLGNITGYVSKRYGRAGLEAAYSSTLLGFDVESTGTDFWSLKKVGSPEQGNDIVLSIDSSVQQLAYRLLGQRKGAVVAVEPSTGRVLAMVSKPGFNPENLELQWENLNKNPESPLLNRAAQGLYPPGSTFKVITAAGILTKNPEILNDSFEAPGYIVIEGRRINDSQAKGLLSFKRAFAVSSNYVFAKLGIELGAPELLEISRKFWLNRKLPFELPVSEGRIPNPNSKLELGETAIGQGRLLLTPLNMVMATAAVANNGVIMAPRLVDEIHNTEGEVVWRLKPEELSVAVDGTVAAWLRESMVEVVDRGTGSKAAIYNIPVAGKTGTAENPHGAPHAWFVGFAPAVNPQVAVAVIIENGGTGGREAAPIAREVIKAVIRKKG